MKNNVISSSKQCHCGVSINFKHTEASSLAKFDRFVVITTHSLNPSNLVIILLTTTLSEAGNVALKLNINFLKSAWNYDALTSN